MNPEYNDTEYLDIIYSVHQGILKNKQGNIIVRVLISGKTNPQYIAFKEAADQASLKYGSNNILYEYLDCEHVRKLFAQPKNLVDWIIKSDVHFILGHIHQGENILSLIAFYLLLYFRIHQGVIEQTQWDVKVLYEEVFRLKYHLGWPWGPKLKCPIVTQNKINYNKVCSSITNPTLEVPMKALIFREATEEEYNEWYCPSCQLYVNPTLNDCQNCKQPRKTKKNKKKKKFKTIKYRLVDSHSEEEKTNITNFCLNNDEGIL